MFENRFYPTKEMYKEYTVKILCAGIFIKGIFIAALAALLCIYGLLTGRHVAAAIGGVCLFTVVFTVLLTPRLILSQLLAADKALHNGQHPECVVTFGDCIKLVEGQQEISIAYSQILGIYRLKSCSVLMFTKQNGIMYVESQFSIGDRAEFEQFILEKCPQVTEIAERG